MTPPSPRTDTAAVLAHLLLNQYLIPARHWYPPIYTDHRNHFSRQFNSSTRQISAVTCVWHGSGTEYLLWDPLSIKLLAFIFIYDRFTLWPPWTGLKRSEQYEWRCSSAHYVVSDKSLVWLQLIFNQNNSLLFIAVVIIIIMHTNEIGGQKVLLGWWHLINIY